MNGIQNHKAPNSQKPFPGCLGRVANLFDLSAGMPENKLLTDKPYRDGSLLSRSRSDVSGMSPVEDQIEDKMIKSESQKTHGIPIKMLIAEEMSKELDSKKKPPSVVAKLMGLDSLPLQKPSTASQRSHSRGSSHSRSQSCVSFGSWQEKHEVHQSQKQNNYKDVYEVWQSHNKYVRDESPQQERFNGSSIEKRMALVRHNFIELKRLSADEKLRQSQQFQDALEVLSSNKDSFLKFLQEPNSMFSQQLSDVQSLSPPCEAKRITILRPAKIECNKVTGPGKKNETEINELSRLGQVSRLENIPGFASPTGSKIEDSQVQATRIVVLKPSPGKSYDIKTIVSPLSSSPKALRVSDPYTDNAQESREVAKGIACHIHENMSRHRRDETLLSSVFSNGYTGDESSFNKSEIEFAAENLSDSEAMSPISRHSWDYIDRLGSPYSLSSFSRASYSPESSVCREAKKRLSERWAMMASNGSQEQKHLRRSSSTLGEMLALSDMKKLVIPVENHVNNEQEISRSTSCFTSDLNNEDKCDAPASNILRSKSVPASSNACAGGLDSEVSHPKLESTDINKELTKSKSMTSLLKGRVSSLFFSKTTRSGKQKSNNSRDEIEFAELPKPPPGNDVDLMFLAAGELPDPLESSNIASPLHSLIDEPKEGTVHNKAGFSARKPCSFIIPIENQEQPSPISVLEPPFQEDDHGEPESSDNFSRLGSGFDLPVHHVKSNLLDKSPPIGSIARTLTWNDTCTDNASPCPIKSSAVPVGAEEERQELFFLVQTLLAAAELGKEVQSDTFLASWHSLESPLDPSLRENYVGLNDEAMHEIKLRHRKSVQNLVFDCVNTALMELAVCGSDPWKSMALDNLHNNRSMLDCLWTQMEFFSGEMSFDVGEVGDRDSLVVEELVRKQVVGKDWVDHSRLEKDNFRKEIEEKLLEELVQEAVEVFTGSL